MAHRWAVSASQGLNKLKQGLNIEKVKQVLQVPHVPKIFYASPATCADFRIWELQMFESDIRLPTTGSRCFNFN